MPAKKSKPPNKTAKKAVKHGSPPETKRNHPRQSGDPGPDAHVHSAPLVSAGLPPDTATRIPRVVAPEVKEETMASPTIPPGLSPNEILAWMGAQVQSPDSSTFQQPLPPPLTPPAGDPSETGTTQWAVAETDTDIALASTPTTVVVGSVFLIDDEYMTVASVSNPDNPAVLRGTYNTVPATHDAGVTVSIWGTVGGTFAAPAAQSRSSKNKLEPRDETKREEARREREEELEEEDADDAARSKKK